MTCAVVLNPFKLENDDNFQDNNIMHLKSVKYLRKKGVTVFDMTVLTITKL